MALVLRALGLQNYILPYFSRNFKAQIKQNYSIQSWIIFNMNIRVFIKNQTIYNVNR